MRGFRAFITFLLIAAVGTFGTFKAIKFLSDNEYLEPVKINEVFLGYEPHYKRGFSEDDKAGENWKVPYINQAIDDIFLWMLVGTVFWTSLGIYYGFKIYSQTRRADLHY